MRLVSGGNLGPIHSCLEWVTHLIQGISPPLLTVAGEGEIKGPTLGEQQKEEGTAWKKRKEYQSNRKGSRSHEPDTLP